MVDDSTGVNSTDDIDSANDTDSNDRTLPFPLSGTTLLLGPSNAGKTTVTARALEQWVEARGGDGVVVFEFGPEYDRGDRLIGGRLDRFTDLLDGDGDSASTTRTDRTTVRRFENGLWLGVLDAHAPRAESATETDAVTLAHENARGAARLLDRAPASPRAVFVNDATIALQHPMGNPDRLLAYCGRADAAVVNAFESDELGTADAVSQRECAALDVLVGRADRIVRLP